METVDASPGAGGGSSLAFDPSGEPVIAYLDKVSRTVRIAHRKEKLWQIKTVNLAGSPAGHR